jgi:hypothetical protein
MVSIMSTSLVEELLRSYFHFAMLTINFPYLLRAEEIRFQKKVAGILTDSRLVDLIHYQ